MRIKGNTFQVEKRVTKTVSDERMSLMFPVIEKFDVRDR